MATNDDRRRYLIRQTMLRRPDTVVACSISMWERLAAELSCVIGEDGFASLFVCSLRLTAVRHPWLGAARPGADAGTAFLELQQRLNTQEAQVAAEASIELFGAFIDILISLIGELLTTHILRTAWGDDATDPAAKELLQ